MEDDKDFLDELMKEATARWPDFPQLAEEVFQRRLLMRDLATMREQRGLTQMALAKQMETSQSAVARLEAGAVDAKLSTIQRYAAALGKKLEWRVIDR